MPAFQWKVCSLAAACCFLSASAMAGLNAPLGTIVTKARTTNMVVTGTQTVASVGNCSRVTVRVTGSVTGTTDDGGGNDTIYIALWDDGQQKAVASVSVPVGTTQPLDVTLGFDGLYATGAPGIAVVVGETAGSSELYYEDPFFPTDVAGSCSDATAVPTLSLTGLLGTGVVLGLSAFGGLRRRRKGSRAS